MWPFRESSGRSGPSKLSRALRGAPPEYMNKFFTNMSAGAAALLKESMDYGRPLTRQIEEEKKNLMDLMTKLERENKITIRKSRRWGSSKGKRRPMIRSRCICPSEISPEPKPDPAKAQECFQAGASF